MTHKAARAFASKHGIEVRGTGWHEKNSQFKPFAHAWRVEFTHGRLGKGRSPRHAGWLQVACVAAVLDALTRDVSQAGKWAPKSRKKFSGAPAWTVVTTA